MYRFLPLLLALPCICPGLLSGQDGAARPAADQNTALVQVLEEVRQLRARVHELEARLDAAGHSPAAHQADTVSAAELSGAAPTSVAEPASPAPSPAASAAEHEDSHHGMRSFLNGPSVTFRGYADLGYSAMDAGTGHNAFQLGAVDLFLTSKLSSKLGFLMETEMGFEGANTPVVEIERIFLSYHQNEYLTADVGRYHSAVGYFNAAFHHGRWFQTAVDRPFLFAFEDNGGILPIHNVGVSFSGRLPSGSLNLHYVAEVGNGRTYNDPSAEQVQTVREGNNGKSVNIALYAAPTALSGWQFGASAYQDHITPANNFQIDQKIYSAHAIYVRDRWEVLNEGVLMRHARQLNPGERVTSVPGFYSQAAYRFGAASKPYFRYEFMNGAASDPIVGPLLGTSGFRRAWAAGYRYDLTEFCALKFQVGQSRRRDLAPGTEGAVALSFAF